MERAVSVDELRAALAAPRREGRTIAFVPTMGALHDGHLSLMAQARAAADVVVASIFVNPTQFGPGEDFDAYPHDLVDDAAKLASASVDVLFTPSVEVMYPAGAATRVQPGPVAARWCGAQRPGHFSGVATIVVKLLDIVQPDVAIFGEKDYQQLAVIRQVVRDLDIPVRVEGGATVREPGGLALSSRNRYLTPEQRVQAAALYRALTAASEAAAGGQRDVATLEELMRRIVAKATGVEVDYAAIVDAATLEPVASVDGVCRALIAARVGSARLIDNVSIESP